jgi:putative nucleotidyltransferase with HDIG domain
MLAPQMNVDDLIRRAGDLPPLPQAAQKALSLIRDPHSNMGQIAEVLSLDPAMAGLILRWANSAYYGLVNPIATVQQAVVYLGQNTVQSLVLTASFANYLGRAVPGYDLQRGDLWKHSVGVAAGARLVTLKFGTRVAEEAYHAGLLCDIGKLAFDTLIRDVDTSKAEYEDRTFTDLEIELFGVDHAALGAEMVKRWKLPQSLREAIAHHHNPSQANEGIVLASAVHIADAAVMMLGIGLGRDGLKYTLDPTALAVLHWNDSEFEELANRIVPLIEEAEKMIGVQIK